MTPIRTLVGPTELAALYAEAPAPVLLDCGFDLGDPSAGEAAHRHARLPGARYAHLDRDLSGARTGHNGRHPLPERRAFARCVGDWGITPATPVVVYDAQGGAFASRAWWMLRWIGHEAVALLDGGQPAWVAGGGAIESGDVPPANAAAPYPAPAQPAMPTIEADALLAQLGRVRLLDARAGARFRGELEPLDPVAGHIPGATLRCFKDNLVDGGRFKSAAALRAEYEALATPAGQIVHQCGSGVTACHNLLAMAHAGLDGSVLYVGSWSEWCADPSRPVAMG